MATIYSISHPSQPNIIYIGKTRSTLKLRLYNHLNSKNNTEIHKWIKALTSNNSCKKPRIKLIEVCDETVSCKREMFWIEDYLQNGFYLLNKYGNSTKTKWYLTKS